MPVPVDVQIPYVESAEIVIDGQASESLWAEAPVFDDFHAYHPRPDAEVPGGSRVRVLTDAKGIYFLFEVFEPDPSQVWAHLTRRDRVWRDDTVGIYLDPAGDGQRGYLFIANAYGVQADAVRVANQRDSFSWDGRWNSVGVKTDTGFQVEFGIPWSSVRHPAVADQIGLSFLRSIARMGQRSGYPRRDPDIQGILVQQAVVGGPGELPANQPLQIMPELTAGYTQDGPVEGRWGAAGVSPGLTLRYDPSAAFTTLGTINPDFSQVESDASQIDINRRYALYLSDRRPFFTEGSEWFKTEFSNLLYTRSMVQPRAGVRVTAESQGWKVAALSVLDSAPSATLSEGGGWTESDMEGKLAVASIIRARRAFKGDSAIGGFYSDRSVLGSSMSSRLAGADLSLRLSDTLILGSSAMGSHTTLADNSTLTGPAGTLDLEHQSRDWRASISSSYISPGFRAENGFITFSDRIGLGADLTRMLYPATDAIPRISLNLVEADYGLTSVGQLRDHTLGPELGIEFNNGIEIEANIEQWGELYEGRNLDGLRYGLSTDGALSDSIGYGLEFGGGDGVYYDESDPVVGDQLSAMSMFRVSPGKRINMFQKISWEQLTLEDELAYRGMVYRFNAELYLDRSTWMRLIIDRSTFSEDNSIEGLFSWEKAPGQAAYVGGSIGSTGDWTTISEPTEWQVFTKVAWAFGT
jgi:hypothetical protein